MSQLVSYENIKCIPLRYKPRRPKTDPTPLVPPFSKSKNVDSVIIFGCLCVEKNLSSLSTPTAC